MSDYHTIATTANASTPARTQSVHADVLVPLAWSAVAGVMLGGGAAGLALWGEWARPELWGLAIGGGTLIVSFFALSAQIRQSWWSWKEDDHHESSGGADPAPERVVVDRPVLVNARKNATKPASNTPISFAQFVLDCEVRGTSEDQWVSILGREQFEAWRDALIEAGWARWRRPNARQQGWVLTAPAGEIVAEMNEDDGFGFAVDMPTWMRGDW